jgi:hypothetical protein
MESLGINGISWNQWNPLESMESFGINGIPWNQWNPLESMESFGISQRNKSIESVEN